MFYDNGDGGGPGPGCTGFILSVYFLSHRFGWLRLSEDEATEDRGRRRAFHAIRNHSNINLNCVCVFHEMK